MFWKNIIIVFLTFNLITPQVFALARCSYDYNGNKTCKRIEPEEIRAMKTFRYVDMYDDNGRKVSLYLKKYKNSMRIINSYKSYIGSGFEDARGNVHIVEKGKIVKSFYASKM